MLESGEGYDAGDVHGYVLAKTRGEDVRRQKPAKWPKY